MRGILYVWVPAGMEGKSLRASARLLARDGYEISCGSLPAAGTWPADVAEGALFAVARRAEDMGQLAFTADAHGLRGAVLYEERYLATFGSGSFDTTVITTEDFALPPRAAWKSREPLIWYTGLLLTAATGGALLPCMDRARKMVHAKRL